MGKPTKDLFGQMFGRLEVIGPADPEVMKSGVRASRWMCRCACDTVLSVRAANLLSGNTKSCGCLQREKAGEQNRKHGLSGYIGKEASPEYKAWHSMKQRCNNPKATGWEKYGGRGIKVCDAWQEFANFYKDMGPLPEPGLTLERIDVDGNYEPGNCIWATRKQQMRNTTRTVYVAYNGVRMSLGEAVEKAGLTYETVAYRRRANWPEEMWFVPLGTVPYGPKRKKAA